MFITSFMLNLEHIGVYTAFVYLRYNA